MTPKTPVAGTRAPAGKARRTQSLSSSLNLHDRLFSTSRDREVARAVDDGIERLEARLFAEVKFSDELADVAARYLLEAGGKRVRPILAMLTAQLGDGVTDEVIMAGASIELTHLASLYHDDVMDSAPVRRGVPTAQNVWGNSIAILVGDLLFARASKLLSILGERAIQLQADTFERLCLGQLRETIGPKDNENPIEHYLQVLSDKTGSLIAASAQMGVIFSNAPVEYEQPVIEFGEKIGVAFQLIDDVLDMSPPAEGDGKTQPTGKKAGTDVRAGVVTLPVLYLRKRAKRNAEAAALLKRIDAVATAKPGDKVDEAAVDAVIAELRAHPVTKATIDEAHGWARGAVDALAPLPDGTVKKTLTRFADTVVDRTN
ncbi:polyprenyl synthetase family protein [Agreia pratensis]|uniref:Heptaprenyl diphosphate synthase n=1 Tax=Agreia pratensis TaxID=150121 RepID=A0A1X7INP6_9MICO|nr:polyprenyl synthetase family protein [Agreia pratensis]MBF4632961.1 polyprenyl synthetase family protein [Agreia pratensis]SMG16642.1 heptaprenyl diphosphate synthase [Agreia pratensis]